MTADRVTVFHINEEADRYFDESSVPRGENPRFVVVAGGVASGKTTFRKQKFATGYVLVDAADIFLSLSRGEYFPFPEAFEDPMNMIGSRVARRAVSERRHIVTELIGLDADATSELLDAILAVGYEISIQAVTCDVEEGLRRNANRGDDDISCYYAEPYQRRWLLEAARAAIVV